VAIHHIYLTPLSFFLFLYRFTYENHKRLNNIGRSYQLRQLNKVRGKLTSILKDNLSVESHSLNKFLEIRKKLLSVEYCGPKIAHGWGLFSLGLTCLSQVDRHLLRIGEALGIIDPDDKN
jgi:hypothetical protein